MYARTPVTHSLFGSELIVSSSSVPPRDSPRLASPCLALPCLALPCLALPRLASPHHSSPHLTSPHLAHLVSSRWPPPSTLRPPHPPAPPGERSLARPTLASTSAPFLLGDRRRALPPLDVT
jgi:hypothetical protein